MIRVAAIPRFQSARGALMAALERNGGSRTAAARELGYRSLSGFYHACQRHGVELRRGQYRVPDEDVPLIRALAAEGLPLAEIARKFETTPSNVWSIVHGRTRRDVG